MDHAVPYNLHNDEADDVQPHGQVAQPTQALERSNTTAENTHNHGDNHGDNEAQLGSRQLRNDLAVTQDQHHDGTELLEGLGDVDGMPCLGTKHSQEEI